MPEAMAPELVEIVAMVLLELLAEQELQDQQEHKEML